MDTLTHALSGALLARATAPKDLQPGMLPRRIAAGFLTAAAPDLDFVAGFFGDLQYLMHHRGISHSVLMLPLWALLLSWLLAKILRAPGGWRSLYGICAMGVGAHIAGDVITSYGTMVFAPLSDWRAVLGTTFIIDLWFSGIILVGLIASLIWRRRRIPAVAAVLVLLSYVGMQTVFKERALDVGRDYAALHGWKGAVVDAQPRPVLPFNWTVYVSDDAAHHHADINLLRDTPRELPADAGFFARMDAPYRPVAMAQWQRSPRYSDAPHLQPLVRAAWNSEALAVYRWFAALPAFDSMSEGGRCVWFLDLRFVTEGRGNIPFNYGACREGPGDTPVWRAYRRAPAPAGSNSPGRVPL